MREKKTDKRKVQGAETKKKLYKIAERLFMEHDFDTVSVEDITYEAGITKGTFYVHFESKDALIALLIADHVTRADMDYKAFLEALPADLPPSQAMLALVEKISDVLIGTIGYANMKKVYQMLLAGTVDSDAVKAFNRELYPLLYGLLEKGIRQGEFKSTLQVESISRHLVMALRGVCYEWCIRHPDFDLKEQALTHFKILLGGIVV